VLGNALVDAYVKRGDLAEADRVHSDIFVQDVVSWSALIAGYAQHRQGQAALECYERMKCQGATPSEVTFVSILNACGSAGAIDEGERIHKELSSSNTLMKDAVLGNALVDMYAKCGALEKARLVLERLPFRNVVTWNTVIAGYAQQGQGTEALACLRRMEGEGIVPNAVSFLCVLNACSHSGLLEDAEAVFEDMTRGYGLSPSLEHETCMVVVYGCAGHFDKVMLLIQTIPRCECLSVWLALLGACRKWGNVKVGRLSFDRIVQLDRTCAAAYVLMSSIYLSAGMREDALKIEALGLENNMRRCP
jgi:pentatricopeptide repeat protein